MFQDWRPAISWVTALSVGSILALGLWLHPPTRLAPPTPTSGIERSTPDPVADVSLPGEENLQRTAVDQTGLVIVAPAALALAAQPDSAAKRERSSPQPTEPPADSLAVASTLPPPILDLPVESTMPTPSPSLAELPGLPPNGVPILMYHYIRVNPVASDRIGFNLSVTPTDFAMQMRLLSEAGFHTVTIAQVREYLLHGSPLPSKPIAITFDDGYDDAYTAARPVLERYHQTATFYVITGFLNRPHYMTWSQVEALDHEGMEIASHTVHHPSLPLLRGSALATELTASRAELESHLGHPVLDFAYPGGELNATVVAAVARAGYLSATTTRSGVARRGDALLELPRLRVWGGETLRQFAVVLGQRLPAWATHPG